VPYQLKKILHEKVLLMICLTSYELGRIRDHKQWRIDFFYCTSFQQSQVLLEELLLQTVVSFQMLEINLLVRLRLISFLVLHSWARSQQSFTKPSKVQFGFDQVSYLLTSYQFHTWFAIWLVRHLLLLQLEGVNPSHLRFQKVLKCVFSWIFTKSFPFPSNELYQDWFRLLHKWILLKQEACILEGFRTHLYRSFDLDHSPVDKVIPVHNYKPLMLLRTILFT